MRLDSLEDHVALAVRAGSDTLVIQAATGDTFSPMLHAVVNGQVRLTMIPAGFAALGAPPWEAGQSVREQMGNVTLAIAIADSIERVSQREALWFIGATSDGRWHRVVRPYVRRGKKIIWSPAVPDSNPPLLSSAEDFLTGLVGLDQDGQPATRESES